MAIRDLFKPKREPDWKHPDPNVRLNAVRLLGSEDHDLLRSLAEEDPAPAVRRMALRKLPQKDVIALLTSEKDADVRDEAFSLLVATATSNGDAALCEEALAGLTEARHIALVAKAAGTLAVGYLTLAVLTLAGSLFLLPRAASQK